VEIAKTRLGDISAPDARVLVREVQDTGESVRSVSPQDLLFVPDLKFFRKRGAEEIALMPFDVNGELLMNDGKPSTGEQYLEYLGTVLPDYYMKSAEFGKYKEALLGHHAPQGSYGW
jgi:hypothetical protein